MNKCENIFWSWRPQTEIFSPTQPQWWSEKRKGRESPLRGSVYLIMCLAPPQFLFLTTTGSRFEVWSLRPSRLFLKEVITGSGVVRSGTNLPGLTFPIFRRNVPSPTPYPRFKKKKKRASEREDKVRTRKVHGEVEHGRGLTVGTSCSQVRLKGRRGRWDLPAVCVWQPFPLAPARSAPSSWPMAWQTEPPHPTPRSIESKGIAMIYPKIGIVASFPVLILEYSVLRRSLLIRHSETQVIGSTKKNVFINPQI